MKKAISSIAVLFLLITSGSLLAGAIFSHFIVRSEGQNVVLEWKTQDEVDVVRYAVERKSVNTNTYSIVAYVKPTGSNSLYSYTDENIYKTSDNLYVYRIAIINEDGSTDHSIERSVSVHLSGVKRTWGSIKAMFR